jgi:hypothetical protein
MSMTSFQRKNKIKLHHELAKALTEPMPAVTPIKTAKEVVTPSMILCSRVNELLRHSHAVVVLSMENMGPYRVIEIWPVDKLWVKCRVETPDGYTTWKTVMWYTRFDLFLGAP